MSIFIVSLIIFASVLLILVILAQNSKGGGLSSQFGGSSTSSMIGVKKTSDLLEKLTWGLAISIMALSMISNMKISDSNPNDFSDRVEDAAPSLDIPNINNLPEGTEEILQPLDTDPDSSN
ncbi:MAG: preprotein translocase subunit SecG [Cyclobacteriaceae bacterium]|nr:preprotein translocase subunit SecG [Cyclobacteriaceae bacterium]